MLWVKLYGVGVLRVGNNILQDMNRRSRIHHALHMVSGLGSTQGDPSCLQE